MKITANGVYDLPMDRAVPWCGSGRRRWLPIIRPDDSIGVPLINSVAIIDPADLGLVSAHTWLLAKRDTTSYAVTYVNKSPVYMHRMITGVTDGVVDHRDYNGLNNRRANLRACSHADNCRNMRSPVGASGFRGVNFQAGKFVAGINVDDRRRYLGRFETKEEAAEAYDEAALRLFGAFAKTNRGMGLLK